MNKLFIICFFTLICACNSANLQTRSEIVQPNQNANDLRTDKAKISIEPLNIRGEFPNNLKRKWKEFTASGQYRLAQISDMTFSEKAKNQLPGKGELTNFYDYAWGDLNYPKRIEDDHLAAIIVDTTKSDSDKFSLVLFSPIKGRKNEYEINWLYRDQDLSKTIVNRASGELYVTRFFDDGSQKSCSVKWNPKIKAFECS